MKISVIGCGYLGAVHAAAMAQLGHEVVGVDVDADKIARLQRAEPPFFEPQLPEVLAAAMASGRLRFSTDIADAAGSRVHFIAVGTPQRAGRDAADLTFVDAAIESLIPYLAEADLVVGKSTVPVGTAARLAARIEAAGTGARLAWNPEFLREGYAVKDTLQPDRLVYGVASTPSVGRGAGPSAGRGAAPSAGRGASASERLETPEPGLETPDADLLNEVYASAVEAGTPVIVTDYATAELVKVAANAYLATKISFINAMAEIAEVTGADVTQLADAIGHDARIGRRFLNAGAGFGGGCLPKDIRGFVARAEELGRGESVVFLKEVDKINLRRRQRVVDLTLDALQARGGRVYGKRVAVLGLAFKPDSDDVRDSPALDVAVQLHGRGANIIATDPQATANAGRLHPQLQYTDDLDEALRDAEVVVLVTEWPQYRQLQPSQVAALTDGRTIIDGRNVLDAAQWRAAGWEYHGLGRP